MSDDNEEFEVTDLRPMIAQIDADVAGLADAVPPVTLYWSESGDAAVIDPAYEKLLRDGGWLVQAGQGLEVGAPVVVGRIEPGTTITTLPPAEPVPPLSEQIEQMLARHPLGAYGEVCRCGHGGSIDYGADGRPARNVSAAWRAHVAAQIAELVEDYYDDE